MAKKVYEKPELKAEKLFEAGARTCCKVDTGTCSTSDLSGGGKEAQTKNVS